MTIHMERIFCQPQWTLAKAGDTITVTFVSQEPLLQTPIAYIAGRQAAVSPTSTYTYQVQVQVTAKLNVTAKVKYNSSYLPRYK